MSSFSEIIFLWSPVVNMEKEWVALREITLGLGITMTMVVQKPQFWESGLI
jgi:hypothetical protein